MDPFIGLGFVVISELGRNQEIGENEDIVLSGRQDDQLLHVVDLLDFPSRGFLCLIRGFCRGRLMVGTLIGMGLD